VKLAPVLLAVALLAHSNGQPPSQSPLVSTGTVGVLVDVSVLDRNGRAVVDLGPGDFELTEDGTRQQILGATFVQNGMPQARTTGSPEPPAAPQTGTLASPQTAAAARQPGDELPTLTAILFDRLSLEGRAAARPAAFAYVSTLVSARDYAGVFIADLSLRTLEPFTNDAGRLRQAVDRAMMIAPANLTDAARLSGRHAPALDPNQPATAGAESGSGFISVADREQRLKSLDPAERIMAEMELRMEEGYRQLTAEYGGDVSLSGISAVIQALSAVRGRKSILYFAETLDITSRLKPRFESLIGQANRSNVTLYTVDASGLRVHSREAEQGRNVNVAGAQGTGDSSRSDGPWTKELERQEQLLTSGARAALGRLAKDTGGFLIENTNNLGAGVARIQQERTNYYLLAYQSTKPGLDGKFRRVNVKVKRSNVTVKARSGYLAIPSGQP
jgi:VWFA-related protein